MAQLILLGLRMYLFSSGDKLRDWKEHICGMVLAPWIYNTSQSQSYEKQLHQFLWPKRLQYQSHQPLPNRAPFLLHNKLYMLSSGTASVPSYSRSWRQKAMAYTEYGYTTVDGNFCKAQLRISNCIPLSADNWTNEEAFHAVINKVIYAISSWTVLFSCYSLQYLYSG